MKHLIFAICLTGALFTLVNSAHSQGLDSSQRRRSRTEQARQHEGAVNPQAAANLKPKFVGDVPSTPGDNDLGEQWILKEKKKPQPFSIFADLNGFYTDNVALTRDFPQNDKFLVSSYGASYQPKIGDKLQLEFTAKQSSFRYDEFDILDFDSLNIGAGATYVIPKIWNIAVFARYNYNRLTDTEHQREFFRNHTISMGLQKAFVLTRSHYLFAGYASQFAFSDPELSRRDEHGIYGGYHLNITRSLETDLFYRIAYFNYVGSRYDINNTLSAALRYNITKWASITASASYGWNRSDQEVFDYEVFNTGGGLSVNVKF